MDFPSNTFELPHTVTGKGVARPKHWLAAYVRLFHEKKTSARLTEMGIENFLPVQEEVHQWSDRRKKIERVLIPMIVFVRVDKWQQSEVLTLVSVNRYMVNRDKHVPLVIPDDQMDRFKFMLDYSDKTVSMSSEPLAPGEKVRVIKGPLKGLEGELVKVGDTTKIAVRLDLLGCASVEMPIGYVEPLAPVRPNK